MNHPQPHAPHAHAFCGRPATSPPLPHSIAPGQVGRDRRMASPEQLVSDLVDCELRENALAELSKKREIFQDLAPLLWHTSGVISALLQLLTSYSRTQLHTNTNDLAHSEIDQLTENKTLCMVSENMVDNIVARSISGTISTDLYGLVVQDIISIYRYLSPPVLSPADSNRVCNALALFQCVASHPETRILFLNAYIPLYLYPFLNTTSKTRPFEYLRLTSLGVIGALVKGDDTEVIGFLLHTEIIPLCLRTMEMGSELSKTVATFIIQKILLDDVGLRYICATADRFYAVGQVLRSMVTSLGKQPSVRLMKHIIRCYLRLSEHPRACGSLNNCLPDILKNGSFNDLINDDPVTQSWMQQLLLNVSGTNRIANL